MILSVLIPTITPRFPLLSRNLWHLQQQRGDFEVLVHEGDEIGMGDKLNRMFGEARGEYVVAVDDDDYLPGYYMDRMLPTLRTGVFDSVGYRIFCLRNGMFWLEIEHDPGGSFDGSRLRKLKRGFCPKIPVRTEIARRYQFGNEFEDDFAWSELVHGDIETAVFVDESMYVYDFWPDSGAFKYDGWTSGKWPKQPDVGDWPFDRNRVRWIGA